MAKVNSEVQTAAQKIAASFNQEVKIQRHQLSQDDMLEFIEHVKAEKVKNPEANISLTNYVADKFYKGQTDVVVVPDLAGLTIGTPMEYDEVENITTEDLDREHEDYLDLSGVDFTGANIKGAKFEAVNLENASFCDTDLSDVSFNDCYMPGADMRGANISNCSLSETDLDDRLSYNSNLKPVAISELSEHSNRTRYGGMHFSTLEPLMHQYRDVNEGIETRAEARYNTEKAEKLELQAAKVAKQEKAVNAKYETLGYIEYARGTNEEYNALTAELAQLKKEQQEIQALSFEENFDKKKIKYVMHPSVAELPLLMGDVGGIKFDPAYKRGSSKQERAQEKQYVRLTREDAESYIEALKAAPQLTMNEFAVSKMAEKGIEVKQGAKVIADFSTYIEDTENALYAGVATDLSGLDFSGANLQEACFAGANLENAKFNGANLALATFEGANLEDAKFIKTTARDVNMFGANLNGAEFSGADFGRAYMSHSSAHEAQVSKTNFNFADIRNGRWDGVQISGSTFNYADLEGVSLANAVIKQTKMQHANLDNAILEGCQMVETDLTRAFMANAKASKLKLQNSILQDVDAREIDLSGAEIDKLCKLSGIDLENAILRRVEADGVNFVGANMEGVKAANAKLEGAILEGVNMRFSDLEGAVLTGIEASGVDMTGANLTDIKARGAKLQNAALEGIVAHNADLTEAVMEGANLRGAKMHAAILERVNLQNADLRNAELEKARLAEANMKKAKVNDATDLHGADVQGVQGDLEHEDLSGKKTKMSAEEKVRRDDEVHKAKQVGFVGKWAGKALKIVGHYTKKVGEFIKQPVSAKWGRIIGAALGAVAVGLFVASVVATGGASLVVLAAAVAGAAVAGGAVGAVAGHYAAKHSGLSTVIGVGGGAAMGGPIGAVLGGGVAIGANQVAKAVVGQSIDELAGNGVIKVGEGAERLGNHVGISEEQEQLLGAHNQAKGAYKAPVREQEVGISENREQVRDQVRQQKQALSHTPAVNSEQSVFVPKAKSANPELQNAAKGVGKKLSPELMSQTEVSENAPAISSQKRQQKSQRSRD